MGRAWLRVKTQLAPSKRSEEPRHAFPCLHETQENTTQGMGLVEMEVFFARARFSHERSFGDPPNGFNWNLPLSSPVKERMACIQTSFKPRLSRETSRRPNGSIRVTTPFVYRERTRTRREALPLSSSYQLFGPA